MAATPPAAMLASLSGSLALAVGLVVMLLPLLTPELSRPRDAAWGAVVLVLGLTLVTSAERLTGSPMLAVLCGGLLIGRLGAEVMQLRWRQLTPEEQQTLRSGQRWQRSAQELTASLSLLSEGLGRGGSAVATSLSGLTAAVQASSGQGRARSGGKRWVRPEPAEALADAPADTVVVSSFAEIDALIEAGGSPVDLSSEAAEPGAEAAAIHEADTAPLPPHSEAG